MTRATGPTEPASTVPQAALETVPDRDSDGLGAGIMHGRMLQVSRLATIGEMAPVSRTSSISR